MYRKELIRTDGELSLVKFFLTPRQRVSRILMLIPDLFSRHFWDGENYVHDSLSGKWETFVDDLKAGVLGYWCGWGSYEEADK